MVSSLANLKASELLTTSSALYSGGEIKLLLLLYVEVTIQTPHRFKNAAHVRKSKP